jgi:hypothetical protein
MDQGNVDDDVKRITDTLIAAYDDEDYSMKQKQYLLSKVLEEVGEAADDAIKGGGDKNDINNFSSMVMKRIIDFSKEKGVTLEGLN